MLLEMTTGATVEIPNSPSDTPIQCFTGRSHMISSEKVEVVRKKKKEQILNRSSI
jgi:hypothetical protein